jgi:hypothetical protein
LLQLDRRLEGSDHADQKVDDQDDRQPVGTGTLHQSGQVRPVYRSRPPQRLGSSDGDVADEIERVRLADRGEHVAADLVEDADSRRWLLRARAWRVRSVELKHGSHGPLRADDLSCSARRCQLAAEIEQQCRGGTIQAVDSREVKLHPRFRRVGEPANVLP